MSKESEHSDGSSGGGPLAKIDGPTALKYAKWGLMGVGGLVIVKIAAGILLSPIGLVAALGAGGYAWWRFGRSGGSDDTATIVTPPPSAPPPSSSQRPAAIHPVPPSAPAAPEPSPRAPASPPPSTAPPAGLPDFARDELAEFDRQLAALDEDDR